MNSNERAFPFIGTIGGQPFFSQGMPLRDYFAAKAMQAFISRHDVAVSVGLENVPQRSYMIADVMMKERGK